MDGRIPPVTTPRGAYDLLLAFILLSMVALAVLYVWAGIVPLP